MRACTHHEGSRSDGRRRRRPGLRGLAACRRVRQEVSDDRLRPVRSERSQLSPLRRSDRRSEPGASCERHASFASRPMRPLCATPTSSSSPCRRRSTRRTGPISGRCWARAKSVGTHLQARRDRRLRVDGLPGRDRGGLRAGPREAFGAASGGATSSSATRPERINPGDKEHTLTQDRQGRLRRHAETLERVAAALRQRRRRPGVHRARSIKVAEAAKVIENTQRDLNIALMNELAIIFDRMGIDTTDVLEAAGTKWNFLQVPAGPGRRPLHRRRPVLPDAQGRDARLPPAGDPRRAAHQRRHGQVRRRADGQA